MVAVPQPVPAPTPEARPPVQRPVAATAITETERASQAATLQSERRPEGQRVVEQGEEPELVVTAANLEVSVVGVVEQGEELEAWKLIPHRLEVDFPRSGTVSSNRVTVTLGPPVSAIGTASAVTVGSQQRDTVSAGGGQDAEAPVVAVESQSRTLEKLDEELKDLHEEARRLTEASLEAAIQRLRELLNQLQGGSSETGPDLGLLDHDNDGDIDVFQVQGRLSETGPDLGLLDLDLDGDGDFDVHGVRVVLGRRSQAPNRPGPPDPPEPTDPPEPASPQGAGLPSSPPPPAPPALPPAPPAPPGG